MALASVLSVGAELQCTSTQSELDVAPSVTHVTLGEVIFCPSPWGRGWNWSTLAVAEGVTPSPLCRPGPKGQDGGPSAPST